MQKKPLRWRAQRVGFCEVVRTTSRAVVYLPRPGSHFKKFSQSYTRHNLTAFIKLDSNIERIPFNFNWIFCKLGHGCRRPDHRANSQTDAAGRQIHCGFNLFRAIQTAPALRAIWRILLEIRNESRHLRGIEGPNETGNGRRLARCHRRTPNRAFCNFVPDLF